MSEVGEVDEVAGVAPIVVCKFGGTSVSTRARWEAIAAVAREHLEAGRTPFIVCSAVSGVSNLLDALLPAALRGEHEPILAEIREKHNALAASMGLDVNALIGADLDALERYALGASLIHEISPRLKANVMARGELMSTRLGAAFLTERLDLPTTWRDARDLLAAQPQEHTNAHRHYLSSPCLFDPDEALQQSVRADEASVTLTQGFIARDAAGDTVLLGRGGSDTSAAYFAARLGAERLEIWTDVPGMFTANPRDVSGARLLKLLDYDEAQELATTGAKVLHPRCLDPVRRHNIPLMIRCTQAADMEGTTILGDVPAHSAQVKAISAKSGLVLVSMETMGMWQQVGFLADAFACFKRNGLSIDLVATSETNVTVSLDPVANALDRTVLDDLLEDLRPFCRAKLIEPCAAVSLVGRNIRAILHKLGGALELFEEQQIYMMSQAASDLNLTFVVTEDQADRLVRELHALIFGAVGTSELFGPTWRELFDDHVQTAASAAAPRWWETRRQELLDLIAQRDEPLYIYDTRALNAAVDSLLDIDALDRLFFAVKSNNHPGVLRLFHQRGLGFECVSPGELAHVRALFPDLPGERLLFTPNFAPIREYAEAFALGAQVTLDNLHPLRAHPEVFRGQDLFVRVDPGVGSGHHKHVRTAGRQSKFGVDVEDLEELAQRAAEVGARIVGLHAHVGSGIHAPETWAENAAFLASLTRIFPDVHTIDVGGGLGVPERGEDTPLAISGIADSLATFKAAHPDLALWMEPGRYLVALAGALLTRVTQLKSKGDHTYVGVESGMNTLIRPALYGAFHEITNLTRHDEPHTLTADIVGPICETGDVLGYARRLPETQEGDVLLIATTGAYGRVMSCDYNLRAPAAELLMYDAV